MRENNTNNDKSKTVLGISLVPARIVPVEKPVWYSKPWLSKCIITAQDYHFSAFSLLSLFIFSQARVCAGGWGFCLSPPPPPPPPSSSQPPSCTMLPPLTFPLPISSPLPRIYSLPPPTLETLCRSLQIPFRHRLSKPSTSLSRVRTWSDGHHGVARVAWLLLRRIVTVTEVFFLCLFPLIL